MIIPELSVKKLVLDAGVFVEDRFVEGVTTPEVCKETDVPQNIEILSASIKSLEQVRLAAQETGDLPVLSPADLSILALALELKAELLTNDYAVQNTAEHLGISWQGLTKKMSKKIEWIWYCPGCYRQFETKGICDACGTELKRRPKTKCNRA